MKDSYRFSIGSDVNKDEGLATSKYDLLDNGYYRAKDVEGLESYKEMKCFTEKDIEVLKQDIQQKVVGYEFKQKDLDALKNKQKNDDQSPNNCITYYTGKGAFWLSSDNTPINEEVVVSCRSTCQISFLYKYHHIVITAKGGPEYIISHWKSYRQQVVDLLNHFEQEANHQSQTKSLMVVKAMTFMIYSKDWIKM